MTVKKLFDTSVRMTIPVYRINYPDGHNRGIPRHLAASTILNQEMPPGFSVTRHFLTEYVEACPWCGARPVAFESNCDGWASTGTCGSPQCNQLQRCEGCGKDGKARYVSIRGQLCESCDRTARKNNLVAARTRYELVPWDVYYSRKAACES